MNSAQIDLALVFQHLDLPIELDTFSQRLNVQKKVYLAQLTGADLGYRFSWYLRGPYSTSLTSDAYSIVDELQSGNREFEEFSLHEATEERLDKAQQLWETPANFAGTPDDWLELLASLHYLRHIAYRPPGATRDFDDCFERLVESKPRFSSMKEQAHVAWQRLDEYGLIENKTLA